MHRSIYISFILVILICLAIFFFKKPNSKEFKISEFRYYPSSIWESDSIRFSYSTDCKKQFFVNLGDGTIKNVTASFHHKYDNAGEYVVVLYSADSLLTDSLKIKVRVPQLIETKQIEVKIKAPRNITLGDNVALEDLSEGSVLSTWIIDDGNEGEIQLSGKQVNYTFKTTGRKLITLKVNNTFIESHTIVVKSPKSIPPITEKEFLKKLQHIANTKDFGEKIKTYKYLNQFVCSYAHVKITGIDKTMNLKSYSMLELNNETTVKEVNLSRNNNCINKITVTH